jgi:hypothetical protein
MGHAPRLYTYVQRFLFTYRGAAAGTARPAGAILLSGPYSFDFKAPSKGKVVYFGEDPTRWPDMVIPGGQIRPPSCQMLRARRNPKSL